jgi:hypothetical protein
MIRKTAHKRTAGQRAAQLDTIARLTIRGKTQAEIAAVLGVSQSQISYDLKEIRQEWRKALKDRGFQEVAGWDYLESVYWNAWDTSQEQREVKSTEKITKSGKPAAKGKKKGPGAREAERLKAALRTEERDGNPAFLRGVERCKIQRARLLGITVEKLALTDPTGTKPDESSGLTDDERTAKVMAIIDALRARAAGQLAAGAGGSSAPGGPPAGPANPPVP